MPQSFTMTATRRSGGSGGKEEIVNINAEKELEKRGHKFVRYADDSMILCRTRKSAQRTLEHIVLYIEGKLFLRVNLEKTTVANISKVKYLGYGFYRVKGKCRMRIHPKSVTKMQKPDKIYVHNPNILYALGSRENIGTVRECFFVNQLSKGHTVEYGKTSGDFLIDGRITVEVGGKDKSFEQIADIPDSYVFADEMEFPVGKKLPLWLAGFLY